MTVHAAKGLSSGMFFVVGLEEDLFPPPPCRKTIRERWRKNAGLFLRVAITRAEENCVLTHARSRYRNGQSTMCSPSRFLKDIDPKYIYTSADAVTDGLLATVVPRFSSNRRHEGEAYVSPQSIAQYKQLITSSLQRFSVHYGSILHLKINILI